MTLVRRRIGMLGVLFAVLLVAPAGLALADDTLTPALGPDRELARAAGDLDRATTALAAVNEAIAGLDEDLDAAGQPGDRTITADEADELVPVTGDAGLALIAERITRSDLLAERGEAEHALALADRAFDAATLRTTWEAGQAGRTGLVWPVGGQPTSQFGPRAHPISGAVRPHDGIDIAAPSGRGILAAKDGTVTRADWLGGYGRTIDIDHGSGHMTRYAHASSLDVAEGDEVVTGQKIAEVGSSGSSTGPHLHFEVHLGAHAVDPLEWY